MIGHLGVRVSALLDGQLSTDEEERAWEHVHVCHLCRDLVEREGWVKTRLAGLSFDLAEAPTHLKGSLMCTTIDFGVPPGEAYLVADHPGARPRRAGLAALGGGAVGAAVMGVLALGAAPADAPTFDRRPPVSTSVNTPLPVSVAAHQRRGSYLP